MLRKSITLSAILLAMTLAGKTGAFQVAGSEGQYSVHSYDQTAPNTSAQSEILPTIFHQPVTEISASEDFKITAGVQNLGLGVPIVRYRFGDSKKYFTNVLKPVRPDVYEFKIMSAALNDKKLDYYIEVVSGSRTLANFGTLAAPITVKVKSTGSNRLAIILGFMAIGTIIVIKVVGSARQSGPIAAGRNDLRIKRKTGKFAKSH